MRHISARLLKSATPLRIFTEAMTPSPWQVAASRDSGDSDEEVAGFFPCKTVEDANPTPLFQFVQQPLCSWKIVNLRKTIVSFPIADSDSIQFWLSLPFGLLARIYGASALLTQSAVGVLRHGEHKRITVIQAPMHYLVGYG